MLEQKFETLILFRGDIYFGSLKYYSLGCFHDERNLPIVNFNFSSRQQKIEQLFGAGK